LQSYCIIEKGAIFYGSQCTVSQKKSPPAVFWHFPKRLGIFNQFFTHLSLRSYLC